MGDVSNRVNARAFLETLDGTFINTSYLAEHPNQAEILASAGHVIRRDFKSALMGLGPLFGEEQLLALCASVIREDFDPDGPQTSLPGDDEEGANG